jgi:hypothetical protein
MLDFVDLEAGIPAEYVLCIIRRFADQTLAGL